jgi:formyltetrahydrofolate deformylase
MPSAMAGPKDTRQVDGSPAGGQVEDGPRRSDQEPGSWPAQAVGERDLQRYTARLLIGCADQPGIVAAVSGFLFEQGANIVSSHQYSSEETGGRFFMRTELFLDALAGPAASAGQGGAHAELGSIDRRRRFQERFAAEVAARFEMDWEVRYWGERRRIAILVSRHDHCLVDLLWRWRRGELDGDVVAVISNHEDLRRETEAAGVAFHHVPVQSDRKPQAEAAMLELLTGRADLLVLARYMQILSGDFLERVRMPAINIHHSFLPAFAGADPYRRARERGVKLIGATAHYVTVELDDGPIIDQDVVRVDHRQSAEDLERVGRDIERLVLARAVALHLDDRVIVDGRRTVVF